MASGSNMTSRVRVIANAEIVTEAVAPRIAINWNPVDNSGNVEFWISQMETLNGVYKGMTLDTRDGFHPMQFSLGEILGMVFDVPVGKDVEGNVVYQNIPGTLLMGTIKAAFDKMYTMRVIQAENITSPTSVDFI